MSETSRTATDEWKWRRREAIISDDYTCQECGAPGGPKGDTELHVHHKTPVAEGGNDDLQNLETLCASCHRSTYKEREGNSGQFEKQYSDAAFIDAVQALDLPTTGDVAEEVGCAHRTALHHLNQLEADGHITSREAGRAKLWALADE